MFKKIMNVITSLLMVVMVLFVCIFFAPKLFGIKPLAVLSGSMEPAYHVGSLVFVKETKPADIKVGDAITFKIGTGDTVVTHRVIEIDKENNAFKTKGDNNNVADGGSVAYNNVMGKAFSFSIPLLGYLAVYMSSKAGLIVIVSVIVGIVVLSYLPDLLNKNKKKKVKTDENRK
ncbi:MAG: signal peptidase I [Longicatena sp.]